MKSFSTLIFSTLLLFITPQISALPSQSGHGSAHLRTIHQFPNETWVENLAVRSNGKILVTLISAPEVWEVDPFSEPTTAELVYTFPDAISLLGIAEYAPDVFAVNVGNFSDKTAVAETGSWSVWSLNIGGKGSDGGKTACKVHKITDVPAAQFLNGMTVLPANPSTILVSDSGAGQVYRVDTTTGEHSVAVEVPAMAPNASASVKVGVNGVQFAPGEDDYLYFTNTFRSPPFSRLQVNPTDGSKAGSVETLANTGGVDDFTLDADGNAWVASGSENALLKVGIDSGSVEVVVGGSDKTKLIGPTACHFGRTRRDVKRGTLYITNNGGLTAPPPQGIVGGGVYAVDTAGFQAKA